MVNTVNFTNVKTIDFCNNEFSCSCGKKHSIKTKKIFLGYNALSTVLPTIKDIMPTGRIQMLISQANTDIANELSARITNAGFNISANVIPQKALPDVKLANTFAKVPEDTRLVISFGDERLTDLAKYHCYKSNMKLIAILSEPSGDSMLVPKSLLYKGGLIESIPTVSPEYLICDLNLIAQSSKSSVASGYGTIMSRHTALIDCEFNKLLTGTENCKNLLSLIKQSMDMCFGASEGIVSGDKQSIGVLTEALIRSSIARSMMDNDILAAEYSTALAIEGMRKHADMDIPKLGELSFIMSGYISKVYEHFFNKGLSDLLLPADRVLHGERIEKYFGTGIVSSGNLLNSNTDYKNIELYRYKIEEFREDFILRTHNTAKHTAKAMMWFKRIYKDSGFWLNSAIAEIEIKIALALGSYFGNKFTVLKYMTEIGCFDRYLA